MAHYQDNDAEYDDNQYDNYDPNDMDSEDDASEGEMGRMRLFAIVEEGVPTQTDNRTLTQAERTHRRAQIDSTWERIRRWLWAHQDQEDRATAASVRGNNDVTPLHLVCKLPNPPADIVQALLEAAPETVTWADTHGWIPLHHACANGASGEVLEILTNAYPEGTTKQDSQSRTPLHFYLTQRSENNNSAAMATNMESLCSSGAAELPDAGGMLPMHYACAYGVGSAVLKVLADAYEDALMARENKGRTPMHLAMVNAHRDASPGVIKFLLERGGREIVDMRDHEGYLPLYLLALGLKGFKADKPEQLGYVSECLKMYLAAEPKPTADFLTALQDLPDWLQDVAVVSPHVRNILNKKIVQRFHSSFLIMDGYFLIIIIACFEIATTEHLKGIFAEPRVPTFDNIKIPLILLLFGGTYFLSRELIQIISLWSLGSFSSWFYDPTNWLDLMVIVLVYYNSIVMTNVEFGSPEIFRPGAAFTKGILWLNVIYFLKSTQIDFAVFVGGVFYVLRRLVTFLMAVAVILVAFAQMFFIVYAETPICDDENKTDLGDDFCEFPHCHFPRSLLKVFTMMMGEIGDETRYETSLVAQLLYVGYAFLVVILLSNVLIAIVTDSYEIVKNDRASIVFWSNRLDFVAEMDAIAYGFRNRTRFLGGSGGNNPKSAGGQVQESPYSTGTLHEDSGMIGNSGESTLFYDGWKSIVNLFDHNLYDDIERSPQNIEFWCYFLFQAGAILIVIPLWITLGALTAGCLWPPQIREYMFVQKETATSRADLEKQKLDKLKSIQSSIRSLKGDIQREMANDRDEMMRLRAEVETVQTEVLSDLAQVRELMTTLLDMGRR